MEIHELNTSALTDPAYVALDNGTDTYKLDFNGLYTPLKNRVTAAETSISGLSDDVADLNNAFDSVLDISTFELYNDVNNLTFITPGDTAFYWIGTIETDCRISKYYGKGTSGVTPYIAVVRNSTVIVKQALAENDGNYQETELSIPVKAGDNVFIGGAVGSMALRSDASLGITIKQFNNASVGDTVTVSTVTSTKFRYNLKVECIIDSLALVEGDVASIEDSLYETKYLYNDVNSLTFITPENTDFYWIGTAENDCTLTKYYGKGTSGVIPYIAVIRNNVIVAKESLKENTGDYLTTYLSIKCKAGDDIYIGGAAGSCALRSDSALGITIKQFSNANVGDTVTVTTVTVAKFRYNLYVQCVVDSIAKLDNEVTEIQNNERIKVTVGTGKDFTKLTDALDYAYDRGNCDVIVYNGTYDIVSELGGSAYTESWTFSDTLKGAGPVVGNGNKYIFAQGANVTFNYTGSNNAIKSDFSPFNLGNGNCEIIGLNLEAKNCRYCIHDEMGRAGITDNRTPVQHIYKDLNLYMDNSANTATTKRECIGGGLGDGTLIEVINSKFKSENSNIPNVYWHSYGSGGVCKIDVTGCDFTTGTFEAQYVGSDASITECFVTNCKMALQPQVSPATSSSTVVNIAINAWNNVIA